MEISYVSRPYKIAKNDRRFKGIVAANLIELKEKCIKSLSFEGLGGNDVDVYLAEDDTLIDDQDYFATVPENTKLLIREATDEQDQDYVDGGQAHEISESQEFSSSSSRIKEIPDELGKRISNLGPTHSILSIMGMSNTELEILSNLPSNVLIEELGFDEDLARVFMDSATKELVRRNDLNEAANLLKLYERAKESKDLTDGIKRKLKN